MEPTTDPSPAQPAASDPLPLRRAVEPAGVGIGAVAILYLLLSTSAGLAVPKGQLRDDVLHRAGYVLSTAVDLRLGVALVVGAVLAAAAAHLGPGGASDRARGAAILTVVAAGVTILLCLVAVRGQYHYQGLRAGGTTTAFHLSQATYAVGVIGPAALALLVALPVLGAGGHR